MKKLAFTLVALSAISSVLALDAANANALFAVGANALPQSGAGFAYLPVDQPATRHRPVPASTVQVGRIVDKACCSSRFGVLAAAERYLQRALLIGANIRCCAIGSSARVGTPPRPASKMLAK
jgi:hypothetical protein